MIQFQCQRCGWCCTHIGGPLEMHAKYLWYNASLKRSMPILLPFERESLLNVAKERGKITEFPVGSFWVDKLRQHVIILTYAFSSEICTFYDERHSACGVYDSRPTICRMYPITSLQAVPGTKPECDVDTVKCPSAISIFGAGDEEESAVVCPPGNTFASIFGTQFVDAVMMEFYLSSASVFMRILMKNGIVKLETFKPKYVSRMLTTYEKVEFEHFYTRLQKEDFRSVLKPLILEKLHKDDNEAVLKGFPKLDMNLVGSWIGNHW